MLVVGLAVALGIAVMPLAISEVSAAAQEADVLQAADYVQAQSDNDSGLEADVFQAADYVQAQSDDDSGLEADVFQAADYVQAQSDGDSDPASGSEIRQVDVESSRRVYLATLALLGIAVVMTIMLILFVIHTSPRQRLRVARRRSRRPPNLVALRVADNSVEGEKDVTKSETQQEASATEDSGRAAADETVSSGKKIGADSETPAQDAPAEGASDSDTPVDVAPAEVAFVGDAHDNIASDK